MQLRDLVVYLKSVAEELASMIAEVEVVNIDPCNLGWLLDMENFHFM
jgi:hypothetical protein